jgi:predicted GH43/DUF377 family glycosyl hydrolase
VITTASFERHPRNPILGPQPGAFYGRAIYNPAALREANGVHLLFRAEAEDDPLSGRIELAWSDDLIRWRAPSKEPVLAPRPGRFDSLGVEPGPPPIPLDEGWLLLYNGWNAHKVHCVGAALFAPDDLNRVLGRTQEPLLWPEQPWECEGPALNIVFGEGAICFDDTLYLYYGAADRVIGLATLALPNLIATLSGGD